jgi:S-ribosylhomocysteine lyase
MEPPSLRLNETKVGPNGDEICTWDLRLAQPNVSHVAMPTIHSIEHFLGTLLRQKASYVVAVAPMGCQTGFYLVTVGMSDFDTMADLLDSALRDIAAATEVPLANPMQCGWAANHTLEGAKRLAAWLLARRSVWSRPTFGEE